MIVIASASLFVGLQVIHKEQMINLVGTVKFVGLVCTMRITDNRFEDVMNSNGYGESPWKVPL